MVRAAAHLPPDGLCLDPVWCALLSHQLEPQPCHPSQTPTSRGFTPSPPPATLCSSTGVGARRPPPTLKHGDLHQGEPRRNHRGPSKNAPERLLVLCPRGKGSLHARGAQ